MLKFFVTIIIPIFLLSGCSASPTSENQGPRIYSTAKLTGEVIVLDNNYNPIADRSGVTVDIDSGIYVTVTDKNGHWECPSYPTNRYSIFRCFKPGFFSVAQLYSINETVPVIPMLPLTICKAPTFRITLDGIIMPDITPDFRTIEGSIFAHTSEDAPDSAGIGIFVIAGRTSNLTIENSSSFVTSIIRYGGGDSSSGARNISGLLTWSDLSVFGAGETVYFKAYPIFSSLVYYNSQLDKWVCDGIGNNGSNVLSGVKK
jgi:hypothetical protein